MTRETKVAIQMIPDGSFGSQVLATQAIDVFRFLPQSDAAVVWADWLRSLVDATGRSETGPMGFKTDKGRGFSTRPAQAC